ncbi:MAG: hypothetical protein AAF298_27910 [Cyanobacteria bacterium P01_A01_bin.40]
MKLTYLATLTAASILTIACTALVTNGANASILNTSATIVAGNPCAASVDPCAAADPCASAPKVDPCAAAVDPCAAANPCASAPKVDPCAAGNPCAASVDPCAAGNPCAGK